MTAKKATTKKPRARAAAAPEQVEVTHMEAPPGGFHEVQVDAASVLVADLTSACERLEGLDVDDLEPRQAAVVAETVEGLAGVLGRVHGRLKDRAATGS
jgi:hypothetical protein